MKAVRFHRHGDPDVLVHEEVPDPAAAEGRALVQVHACALNRLDLWERRGIERVPIPLPHISGSDVAGTLLHATGTLPAGTRVLLQPGLSCGRCPACREGRDNLCPSYDVLGLLSDGGYAELVSVPAGNIVAIPDHVGFVEAAAFPLTFLTAWHMLVTLARVRADDVVLVLAGGSGVGQAAIQIAALHGARVFATAAASKHERTRALGVEDVFDHYAVDYAQQVKALTAGYGADIVVEHVGAATWDRSVRALARGGRLVTCGATTGPRASLDLRHLFARQLSLVGSYMGTKGELIDASRLFFAGKLRPVIDEVVPLAKAADAHRRLEAADQFGKIVLSVTA
jgi:NADPH:quinone reductase-like Zn-dependent oxidoreductase